MRRSNLAFESQHLLHAVDNAGIKNWVSLSEGQQGSLGWLTTNERKVRPSFFPRTPCVLALTRVLANAQQQMCLLLREAMTVGKIALAREFFSNELGAAAAKQRIKDELSSYCVVTEAPKTTFGKVPKYAVGLAARRQGTYHGVRMRLAGQTNLHGQALRQAGRPLHRDAT